jgi:uncharacterized phiE125 gp8 family phage protein
MTLRLLTAPEGDIISVDEAKVQVAYEDADKDAQIEDLIAAAVAHLDGASGILGRCLLEQEWALDVDGFSDRIVIPLAPVVSVDAVKYLDGNGAQQTLAGTVYRAANGVVTLKPGQSWPTTYDVPGAVSVEFTAGYGTEASDVPLPLRRAMLMLIAHWFNVAEGVSATEMSSVPMAVDMLTTPFIFRAS